MKCQYCNRAPQSGNNRPWSKKATRRTWNVNVQKVQVVEGDKVVSRQLCTSCLRTTTKVGRS